MEANSLQTKPFQPIAMWRIGFVNLYFIQCDYCWLWESDLGGQVCMLTSIVKTFLSVL